MMQFNLLETRAGGQDIWLMGKNEGRTEGKREGKQEGKLEGKQEGKVEEKLEIAKAMLLEGSSISFIAKVTQLPEKKVMTLKSEIEKIKFK